MSYNHLFSITLERDPASTAEPLADSAAVSDDRFDARYAPEAAETAAVPLDNSSEAAVEAVRPATIRPFGSVSASNETLAALLDQSLDCIKLISADGAVQYMNPNGQCAMEVDDLASIHGRQWVDLWPDEAKSIILDALQEARTGKAVRFHAFCPTAKGAPRWWDVSVSLVSDASGTSLGFLSVSRDVTETHLAKELAEIAAAEMIHRLGNSYAMVASLLSAYARGNPPLQAFASEMRERLSALAVAQTASLRDKQKGSRLKDLLEDVLRAFATPDCPIVVRPFADIRVDQAEAQALALVFGELAVNSSKHGALSARGDINVNAEVDDKGFIVRWEERSNRAVEGNQRTGGQGLSLMSRVLKSSGGVLTVDWMPFGLDAAVRIQRP